MKSVLFGDQPSQGSPEFQATKKPCIAARLILSVEKMGFCPFFLV